MKIYEEPHRFHGLTWRIVICVYYSALENKLIAERPNVRLYDNGDPAEEWHGQHFPDVSREEVLSLAKQLTDPVLLREPNFGKRSLAILHEAMGGAEGRSGWSLEKRIKHLSQEHRRQVSEFVDKLLEEQQRP